MMNYDQGGNKRPHRQLLAANDNSLLYSMDGPTIVEMFFLRHYTDGAKHLPPAIHPRPSRKYNIIEQYLKLGRFFSKANHKTADHTGQVT